MKKFSMVWLSAFMLLIVLSSCAVAGGIFKAGMGFGIFIVILVVVLILWLVSRGRR